MNEFKAGHRTIWFPSDPSEARACRPTVVYHALARKVLAVATTRIEGTWRVYVDAVPGERHEREVEAVLERGSPLPYEWAWPMFPEFKNLPYSH